MITTLPKSRLDAMDARLGSLEPGLTRVSANVWETSLRPPGPVVRLSADAEWLNFDCPIRLPDASPNAHPQLDYRRLHCIQAKLGGGVKFALRPAQRLGLHADLFLAEDPAAWGEPVNRVFQAFDQGLAAVCTGRPGSTEPCPGHAFPNSEAAILPALMEICGEADWEARRPRDGSRVGDLELPDVVGQATLVPYGPRGLGARLRLSELDGIGAQAWQAVAVFLLLLNDRMRLVRAGLLREEDHDFAVLEGLAVNRESSAEVSALLSGLSTGAQLCSAELAALLDEETARDYLTVGDWNLD